jgi:hypothetical protein
VVSRAVHVAQGDAKPWGCSQPTIAQPPNTPNEFSREIPMTAKSNSTKPCATSCAEDNLAKKEKAARKKAELAVRRAEEKKKREKELAVIAECLEHPAVAPTDDEIALAKPTPEFANGRQLAKAIAEQCDLVAVGSKLLRDGEAKGASVRARMFETTVEYLYGKPAAAPSSETPQILFICDIPRPVRDIKPK